MNYVKNQNNHNHNLIKCNYLFIIFTHKSSDYKLTAVKYFLYNNVSQVDTYKIFNCNPYFLISYICKSSGKL